MAKRKRKQGRPTVFTAARKKEILAILATGGSRNDAADYTGIGRSTLSEFIARNEKFSEQTRKAEAEGKLYHLRRIKDADPWQASAWLLERKYPDEYGRRVRAEVSGPDGGPIRTEVKLEGLDDDKLEELYKRAMAGEDVAAELPGD